MKQQSFDKYDDMCHQAAKTIADLIRTNNEEGRKTVLGLATGGTQEGVYDALVAMYEKEPEALSFKHVVTFNLDEYWPCEKNDSRSFFQFMKTRLFDKVDIDQKNHVHFLDGTVAAEDIEKHCTDYQQAIAAEGGLDLQLLGIGPNGHIAFNEPKANDPTFALNSGTRRIKLSEATKEANTDRPSDEALTMGIGDIMKAKSILLLANGAKKAQAVYDTVEAPYNAAKTPSSVLRFHKNFTVLTSEGAQSKLTGRGPNHPMREGVVYRNPAQSSCGEKRVR